MVVQGIFFGVLSAAFASLTFLFARVYMTRPASSPMALFAVLHIWIGGLSTLLLPLLRPEGAPGIRAWAGPLALAGGLYIAGQLLFFFAVRRAEASRVSPLLGLKILFLAVITVLVLRHPLAAVQWLAVALSLVAAVGLNYSGGALPVAAALAMIGASFVYAISDFGVTRLAEVFSADGGVRGSMYASCVNYVLCLFVALLMLPFTKPGDRRREHWLSALPMALCWLGSGLCLFACFRAIGPLFGNIVQSLRGPFSVLLAVPIAMLGHVHLEQKLTRGVFLSRLASAVLMCAAIALFMLGR